MNHRKSGFTLVELSIVLVIIGLLIGGILGGQELIRASELNSVVADANKFRTSVNAFRLKYNALPGDMPNATAYWPTATTTNGDNDSLIESHTEVMRAWQHLSLSGIIPGNYTGVLSDPVVGGTNAPATKVTGGIFIIRYTGVSATSCMKLQNNIEVGVSGTGVNAGYANVALFSAPDTQAMDAKSDDGLACAGKVRGIEGAGGVTGCPYYNATSGNYNLSLTAASCNLDLDMN